MKGYDHSVKVALLTTSFPLYPGSSSGIFVERLINHCCEDIEFVVITPADQHHNDKTNHGRTSLLPFRYAPSQWQLLAHGAGGIPVALREKPWLYAFIPAFLTSMLFTCIREARSCDVIHANWAICGCVAGLVGKLYRIPVITTLRGEDVARAQKSLVSRFILSVCLRLSNRVVCVSNSIGNWITETFACSKSVVIENGVDNAFLGIRGNHRRQNSVRPVRLLTVGSLIPRKSVDHIVSAIARIYKQVDISFKIIGAGSELNRLKTMVQTNRLEKYVEFAGTVDPKRIPSHLANADIFILASRSEGRPNVILEAMAAGLPVVASDIDGVNELVEQKKNGLLFAYGMIEDLANCIRELVEKPALRSQMGDAAKRTIEDRGLIWTKTASAYSKLYWDLVRD